MRVTSLNDIDRQISPIDCEICIIGAGAAGLYLADRLQRLGRQVVVLEAGPLGTVTGLDLDLQPVFAGDVYSGATTGRFFGLGGSTAKWGGALVPYREQDRRADSEDFAHAWDVILDAVERNSGSVSKNLGLPFDPVNRREFRFGLGQNVADLEKSGLDLEVSTWLPFRKRNFRFLTKQSNVGGSEANVYVDAIVANWKLSGESLKHKRVTLIEAKNSSGKQITVQAKTYIIAAGAIESARVLLEISALHGNRIFPNAAAIGRNLSDHLSWRIAAIQDNDRARVSESYGPKFTRGMMRSYRLLDNSPMPSAPRYFGHFIFDIDNPAFKLARVLLQGFQSGSVPKLDALTIRKGLVGLGYFASYRLLKSRLYIPDGTRIYLQLDMEQWPDCRNAVTLSAERDNLGRLRAVVNWRVTERDEESLLQIRRELLRKLNNALFCENELVPLKSDGSLTKPHDAYHPVGVCRMGEDSEAVVDDSLFVRGVENIAVLSTGVFPSAGTANPTFSLLCLAEELALKLNSYFH